MFFPLPFFLTIVRTPLCLYLVESSVPIGQMVFNDYTKCRILLLRERGKRTKEISELLLKEDIRASHRGISKFLSRYKQRGVRTIVRKKGSGKNTLHCKDRLIYITYRLFTVERTVNLHHFIYHLNAPCRFSHIVCSCNGKIVFCDPYCTV